MSWVFDLYIVFLFDILDFIFMSASIVAIISIQVRCFLNNQFWKKMATALIFRNRSHSIGRWIAKLHVLGHHWHLDRSNLPCSHLMNSPCTIHGKMQIHWSGSHEHIHQRFSRAAQLEATTKNPWSSINNHQWQFFTACDAPIHHASQLVLICAHHGWSPNGRIDSFGYLGPSDADFWTFITLERCIYKIQGR